MKTITLEDVEAWREKKHPGLSDRNFQKEILKLPSYPSNPSYPYNQWKNRGSIPEDLDIQLALRDAMGEDAPTQKITIDNIPVPLLRYSSLKIQGEHDTMVSYDIQDAINVAMVPQGYFPSSHRIVAVKLDTNQNMSPTLRENDLLFIDLEDKSPDDSLFMLNWKTRFEDFTIRRITSLAGNRIKVYGETTTGIKAQYFKPNDKRLTIVGKVIYLFRKL